MISRRGHIDSDTVEVDPLITQDCSQDLKGLKFEWALNKDHIIALKVVLEGQLKSSRGALSKVKEVHIVPQLMELLH